MMKAVECGENDLTHTMYRCGNCGCESLEEWMGYCHSCGKKITKYQARCTFTKRKHDKGMASLEYHSGDYDVQCDLPDGHKGKHEGTDIITGRKNTWRD
jgi:predicted ATP-dependent serine protease